MKRLKLFIIKPVLVLGLKILRMIWFFTRPVSLGVEGIVINDNNQVLLVTHTYRSGWQLPGGGVNRGEDVFSALARELREEVGVACPVSPNDLLGIFYAPYCYRSNHVCTFVIKDWESIEPFNGCIEIEEARFFEIGSLPDQTGKGARERINLYLAGLSA